MVRWFKPFIFLACLAPLGLLLWEFFGPTPTDMQTWQWDYERVTYDKKYEIKEGTFYLRVFGFTKDGDVGAHDANITLLKPVIGKHYYPHGVEYGENEVFPNHLLKSCEQTLAALKTDLAAFEIHA